MLKFLHYLFCSFNFSLMWLFKAKINLNVLFGTGKLKLYLSFSSFLESKHSKK